MTKLEHADFKRVWLLKREITHSDQPPGKFEGLARITRRWTYLEWGNLEVRGRDFTAGRRYWWKPMDGGFDIHFEDGKPFHELHFNAPSARHYCDPDIYDVRYDFSDWPKWRSTWDVQGPRKSYSMTSLYAPFSAMQSLRM
ncbi:MAG: DUF6314 family protein [Rhodobacteraceae bacterium]|nr:DUF6314 family protein [Paracoccaceae bacterium]